MVTSFSSVPLIIYKVMTGFGYDGNSVTFLSVTGETLGESVIPCFTRVSGDFSSWMTSITFFAVSEACNSPSSSDESHPSESWSSSLDGLAVALASSETCLIKFLFSNNFLTSQKAYRTYLPTFCKSLCEKCCPERAPLLAPAKEDSRVNTNGIRSLWNIVIRAVESFDLGIE